MILIRVSYFHSGNVMNLSIFYIWGHGIVHVGGVNERHGMGYGILGNNEYGHYNFDEKIILFSVRNYYLQ